MRAYSEAYLEQIVETQGQLFDFVSYKFPECDTKDFINKYMQGYIRQRIDKADAYLANEDVEDLYAWFIKLDNYSFNPGKAMTGFKPDWIGEFYAYFQWYYNIPSKDVIEKVPLDFLEKAYYGLHDLDLELAVEKVGEQLKLQPSQVKYTIKQQQHMTSSLKWTTGFLYTQKGDFTTNHQLTTTHFSTTGDLGFLI